MNRKTRGGNLLNRTVVVVGDKKNIILKGVFFENSSRMLSATPIRVLFVVQQGRYTQVGTWMCLRNRGNCCWTRSDKRLRQLNTSQRDRNLS